MTIQQLVQQAVSLERIVCYQYDGLGSSCIAALTFVFNNQSEITLSVITGTDEFSWVESVGDGLRSFNLEQVFPIAASAYGLSLAWCWEMKNSQGYFDAVQFEFVDNTLRNTRIFQFKVAASNIEFYNVSPARSITQ